MRALYNFSIYGDSISTFEGYNPEGYAVYYNTAIRKACRKEHCFIADLDALNLRYETLDGSHPNKTGHKELANAWITVLDTIIKSMLITTQTTISGNVVYY